MNIMNYQNFNESVLNLSKDELKRFKNLDLDIKHKILLDNSGVKYNIWYGKNAKSNDYLTKMYSGIYSNTLGGYAPSKNDIWMHVDSVKDDHEVMGTHLIIKTNGDNIIPDDIIKSAAVIVKNNSVCVKDYVKLNLKKIDDVNVVFCRKDYVRKEKYSNIGEVTVDTINRSYVVFSRGNIKISDKL